jgi:hypothetical protein
MARNVKADDIRQKASRVRVTRKLPNPRSRSHAKTEKKPTQRGKPEGAACHASFLPSTPLAYISPGRTHHHHQAGAEHTFFLSSTEQPSSRKNIPMAPRAAAFLVAVLAVFLLASTASAKDFTAPSSSPAPAPDAGAAAAAPASAALAVVVSLLAASLMY